MHIGALAHSLFFVHLIKNPKLDQMLEELQKSRWHLDRLVKNNRYHDRQLGRECDLTFDKLVALLQVQKGLCYYSNAPLSLDPDSFYYVSVERVNNDTGHVIGNVVLICNRFQSSDQSKDAEHGESAQ